MLVLKAKLHGVVPAEIGQAVKELVHLRGLRLRTPFRGAELRIPGHINGRQSGGKERWQIGQAELWPEIFVAGQWVFNAEDAVEASSKVI